jgi:hypothetical protein
MVEVPSAPKSNILAGRGVKSMSAYALQLLCSQEHFASHVLIMVKASSDVVDTADDNLS